MTPQEIEALKAERDALLQELHKANSIIIDLQRNPPKFTAEYLRDVQAEAGRAGYYEGFRAGLLIEPPTLPPQNAPSAVDYFRLMIDRTAEVNADIYAATVRQGGAE